MEDVGWLTVDGAVDKFAVFITADAWRKSNWRLLKNVFSQSTIMHECSTQCWLFSEKLKSMELHLKHT